MHIDQVLATFSEYANSHDDESTYNIPSGWGQGRTAFGGISAASLLTAMQSKIEDDRVLRSINYNFVGPLTMDQPLKVTIEILREGKNTSQVTAKLSQNNEIVLMAVACFGVHRDSKIDVREATNEKLSAPDSGQLIPAIKDVTPEFIQHVELAITDGNMPFSSSPRAEYHGRMRYKVSPQKITDAHLIALIDAWPPTVLQMYNKPAPASTMSWNIEFIHPHKSFSVDEWFGYHAITRQASDGYAHTEANIWDDAGELVAVSRQTVTIFS